ncbi:unnamed protein product [Brassica rapa subsp. narinosa]
MNVCCSTRKKIRFTRQRETFQGLDSWQTQVTEYIAFCKNGEDCYRTIPTRIGVHFTSQGIADMVLRGDILYVYTTRPYVRLLDLSGHEGFMQVTKRSFILPFHPAFPPSSEEITYASRLKVSYNIAVTRSGDVLLVKSMVFKATTSEMMMFHLYETDRTKLHLFHPS